MYLFYCLGRRSPQPHKSWKRIPKRVCLPTALMLDSSRKRKGEPARELVVGAECLDYNRGKKAIIGMDLVEAQETLKFGYPLGG